MKLVFSLLFALPLCVVGLVPAQTQSMERRRALGLVVTLPLVSVFPAFADEASDAEAEEEARIRRKLAAQAKAGSDTGKKSYSEELKAEREKERELSSKSKKEKREDMCELLGRGC